MLFGPLRSLLVALQGGDDPKHIAAGFALGAAWGLVPKGNLFGILFLLFCFLVRVDKSMAVVSALLFTAVGYAVDPLAHSIGRALLTSAALKPLWTALYDLPIVPLTRFNNSVVLGSLVIGLALFWPLYASFIKVVEAYRAKYKERVDRWPIVKAFKSLSWYETYRKWTA